MARPPAATLALALALAGCGGGGGDESDAFRDGYNAAVERLTRVGSEVGLGEDGERQSNREVAADFRRIADTWRAARADLARLDPPADAREELDELLEALNDGVADLRAAARAAGSNDPEAFREAQEALGQSGEEISEAENDLKRAVD